MPSPKKQPPEPRMIVTASGETREEDAYDRLWARIKRGARYVVGLRAQWLERRRLLLIVAAKQVGSPVQDTDAVTETKQFFTKMVGVTFRNDDGSRRQKLIARCKVGERLKIEHEPDNPHSDCACGVYRQSGQQLGHLSEEVAGNMVRQALAGWRFAAFVEQVTGGGPGKPSRGMNLRIVAARVGEAPPRAAAALTARAAV